MGWKRCFVVELIMTVLLLLGVRKKNVKTKVADNNNSNKTVFINYSLLECCF